MEPQTDLQLRLFRQLLQMIADGALERGAHLAEIDLSNQFGVSRTPIRAALALLLSKGVVERDSGRKLRVAIDPDRATQFLDSVPQEDEEKLKGQIARDWFEGTIPREVSESFFRTRYNLGRTTLSKVLSMLSDEGIIARLPGYGWQFEPTLNSGEANDASYDFRLLVEPGGILQSTFVFDRAGGEAMRARHERTLEADTHLISELFRLDEDFHLFIAGCSNNAFILQAVDQQNKLRRLLEYESLIDTGRLNASCREHVEILDALEAGSRTAAAKAMKKHLMNGKLSTWNWRQESA